MDNSLQLSEVEKCDSILKANENWRNKVKEENLLSETIKIDSPLKEFV